MMAEDEPDESRRGMAYFTSRVYEICHLIPFGHVTTYGHIAKLAGYPRHSRHVGNALKELPEGSTVPWHRVISSKGMISPRPGSGGLAVARQRQRLMEEGIEVTTQRGAGVAMDAGEGGAEKVDIKRWGWFPESLP